MNFGKKLRSFRLERNLTQKELAKMLNTSQSTIHLYETGQRIPNASTISGFIKKLELNKYEVASFLADFEVAKEENKYFDNVDDELEEALKLTKELDEAHKRFIISIIKEAYKNVSGLNTRNNK